MLSMSEVPAKEVMRSLRQEGTSSHRSAGASQAGSGMCDSVAEAWVMQGVVCTPLSMPVEHGMGRRRTASLRPTCQ